MTFQQLKFAFWLLGTKEWVVNSARFLIVNLR